MLRPVLFAIALAVSGLAWGESLEPLEGIARLSYVEGKVSFQAAEETSSSALPERPLVPGDRLTTGDGGRLELGIASATLRADEQSVLSLAALGDSTVRIELTAGTASLHLRDLLEGESFAIVTPNTTIAFQAPGEYRVDVLADGATELTVRTGAAELATEAGPVRVADGQRARLEGRSAQANLIAPQAADKFDEWVLEREVQLANASPREAPDEYYDEQLDRYGEWRDDPRYGRVWMPSYAYGGYDPFGNGYWQRSGYGYSWYDPMPWSGYTSGYGRWRYVDDRWCWLPRRHRQRDNDPGPVATVPRQIDSSGHSIFRRTREQMKQTQSGSPEQVASSSQSPPPRSTPVPQRNPTASTGGSTTMKPTRPAETRTQPQPRSQPQPRELRELRSTPTTTSKGSPPPQPQ